MITKTSLKKTATILGTLILLSLVFAVPAFADGPGDSLKKYVSEQVGQIILALVICVVGGYAVKRQYIDMIWYVLFAGFILFIAFSPDSFKTVAMGWIKAALGIA